MSGSELRPRKVEIKCAHSKNVTTIIINIIIIITSSGDLQPSTAIANQLPSQIVSTQIRTTDI